MAIDVALWLRGLGFEQYVLAFVDNKIDDAVLPELTAEDLVALGITAVGHRRRLLSAIAALRDQAPGIDAAASAAASTLEAERRQLTIMFCDLVGSTALSARFDLEDLREIVGVYHRCVTETVARFDGFVAKYMGDGVLVYFGYPQAHEDDAERAVGAGLAVISAVGKLDLPEQIEVRLGVASGLVVVGDLIGEGAAQERGVIGETPNLAARLQAVAQPGTLVICESTRRQVGELFEVEDLGPQKLAGLPEPQSAWRAIRESGVVSRFEALRSGKTPLVGREQELDLLLRLWTEAKTGEGRAVLLSGEPGIGKSRLTSAVQERILGEPHTRIRYFCSPHHQHSALYPIVGQLERAAGFARDDAPAAKFDSLAAVLSEGAEAGDISLIAEMMSLPGGDRFPPLDLTPQLKKERTLAAMLRQLEVLVKRQPVFMVFEDLHWIDPTSRELLDLVIERIGSLPVLLIATYRPEFQHSWAGQPQVTAIALSRLDRSEGAALVHQLLGNFGSLPPDIVDEIVERTDGVPLFVEEMTKAVVEAGTDSRPAMLSVMPAASLRVPATLHASLLGRLDRLGPAAKQVSQVAAAIGRDFSYELIAAAAQLAVPVLQDALRRLVESGLVFQRGVPPTAEYLFKHALVQDTAYSTLLRGPRQALHRQIAEALEQRFPDVVERRPEIVAHHFGEAAIADKSIIYWHLAGKSSVARSAVREAVAQLRRGLSLLNALAESRERNQLELDIQITLIAALMVGKGYADPEVFAALERANQLVSETASVGTPLHFSVLYGLWVSNAVGGTARAAVEHSTNLLTLAQSQSSSNPLLVGHRTLASSLILSGDYRHALEHVERAVCLYRPDEHGESAYRYGQDIGVSALVFLSWALWHRGCPNQSVVAADRALAYSRDLKHAHTLAHTLWYAAMAATFARDVAATDAYSSECVAIASLHGFALWTAWGKVLHGWAVAQKGEATTGIVRIHEGLAAAEATGAVVYKPVFLGLLAEALALAGKIEEGLASIDQGLARSTVSGERGWDAELYRLRGELMRRLPQFGPAKAETAFRAALKIAREQGTCGYELRAATSLARLLVEQAKTGEARDLLSLICGQFTEGFDTADFKESKALLDQLR
jgi:class 3 adenylate cyclase/predicted ATPase